MELRDHNPAHNVGGHFKRRCCDESAVVLHHRTGSPTGIIRPQTIGDRFHLDAAYHPKPRPVLLNVEADHLTTLGGMTSSPSLSPLRMSAVASPDHCSRNSRDPTTTGVVGTTVGLWVGIRLASA